MTRVQKLAKLFAFAHSLRKRLGDGPDEPFRQIWLNCFGK